MHRASTSASSAAEPHVTASDRPASYPRWRPSFGTASGLAAIISRLLKREDPRLLAQDAAVKSLALLQARKAVLLDRKEALIAEIVAARQGHRATSSLIAELQAVTTEILAIG